jgi:hypothetical protein
VGDERRVTPGLLEDPERPLQLCGRTSCDYLDQAADLSCGQADETAVLEAAQVGTLGNPELLT